MTTFSTHEGMGHLLILNCKHGCNASSRHQQGQSAPDILLLSYAGFSVLHTFDRHLSVQLTQSAGVRTSCTGEPLPVFRWHVTYV